MKGFPVAASVLLLLSLGGAPGAAGAADAPGKAVPPGDPALPAGKPALPADNASAPLDNAVSPPPDLSSVLPDNSWVDRTHAYLARESLETVQRFDDFFGDRTREAVAPAESTFRWRNAFRSGTDRAFTYRTDLRASVRLTMLSRKLRLVFSSETFDDVLGINRDATGEQGLTAGGTFRQSSTELRYEFLKSPRSEADIGAGVRVKLPLVFYTRARYRYTLPLTEKSQLLFWPTAFWRTHDGLGQSTAVDYQYRLASATHFRWANSETSTQKSAGVEWTTEPGILHAVAPGKALALAFGVTGATRPFSRVTGFYTLARYRQSLVREWILAEAEPMQSWQRSELGGYRPVSAITFRLDLVFRGIRG